MHMTDWLCHYLKKMICKERKLLFLHPHRNGGKSIEDAIFNIKPRFGTSCHKPIAQHIKEGIDINSYYTFMFCRNPWDRAVSLWSWYGKYTFNDFVRKLVKGKIQKHRHFVIECPQQLDWIGKPTSKIIKLDFLGRFENYQEDFNKLCKNLDMDLKLPHHNTRNKIKGPGHYPHKYYSTYYNDESYELITKAFSEDIKYFGYKFEENA